MDVRHVTGILDSLLLSHKELEFTSRAIMRVSYTPPRFRVECYYPSAFQNWVSMHFL